MRVNIITSTTTGGFYCLRLFWPIKLLCYRSWRSSRWSWPWSWQRSCWPWSWESSPKL